MDKSTGRKGISRIRPPWDSRFGARPNVLFPPAIRALWLDGWQQGYWDGYERAHAEYAALLDDIMRQLADDNAIEALEAERRAA